MSTIQRCPLFRVSVNKGSTVAVSLQIKLFKSFVEYKFEASEFHSLNCLIVVGRKSGRSSSIMQVGDESI